MGGRKEDNMTKLTPMKAIREKCLDCCSRQTKEVRNCVITSCPLWSYRTGHRPKAEETTTQ